MTMWCQNLTRQKLTREMKIKRTSVLMHEMKGEVHCGNVWEAALSVWFSFRCVSNPTIKLTLDDDNVNEILMSIWLHKHWLVWESKLTWIEFDLTLFFAQVRPSLIWYSFCFFPHYIKFLRVVHVWFFRCSVYFVKA